VLHSVPGGFEIATQFTQHCLSCQRFGHGLPVKHTWHTLHIKCGRHPLQSCCHTTCTKKPSFCGSTSTSTHAPEAILRGYIMSQTFVPVGVCLQRVYLKLTDGEGGSIHQFHGLQLHNARVWD
jgi:hypothetical protein